MTGSSLLVSSGLWQKESDDKSRRIRRKQEADAQAGKIAGGGRAPMATRRTSSRPRVEAVVIRSARPVAGGRGAALDLHRSERAWCADLDRGSAAADAAADAYRLGSGQREHNGEIVATAEWPAIISPAETSRIRALLSDPDRRTNRVARRYLLVRLLRCGVVVRRSSRVPSRAACAPINASKALVSQAAAGSP